MWKQGGVYTERRGNFVQIELLHVVGPSLAMPQAQNRKSIVSMHLTFSKSLPFVRGYSVKLTSWMKDPYRIIGTQPSESNLG